MSPPPTTISLSRIFKLPKLKAFTLAETLITLTIIGVIAALTIPNLMQSYRKHEIEVRLKDTYSIIYQAVRMAEVSSNTDSDEWDYTNLTDVKQYLWPMFKDKVICSGAFNNYFNGKPCVGKEQVEHGYVSYLDMDGQTIHYWISNSIILANGASIAFYPIGDYNYVKLWIDVNGPKKGPAQLGYDIFYLYLLNKSSDLKQRNPRFVSYDFGSWQGFADSALKDAKKYCVYGGRADSPAKDPAMCYAYIMQNGWKIPDDYPIKKW